MKTCLNCIHFCPTYQNTNNLWKSNIITIEERNERFKKIASTCLNIVEISSR